MSNQWVQTYQIQTSIDGRSFTDYKQNNIVKVMLLFAYVVIKKIKERT